jgi:predicted HTH domain antitoxin
MNETTKTTVCDVLALARRLSESDRRRLAELLSLKEDEPLPERVSLIEAIELYLADACSLSRAAELAGVTRWDIINCLKERGIKIPIVAHRTAQEIDALAEELELQGILSPVVPEKEIPVSSKKRVLGMHRGQIWVSDDFDDPLPDEFWLGEE